jgi:hypothetical protein
MIHATPHPLAGQTVKAVMWCPSADEVLREVEFRVEDWWDRVSGESWMDSAGNPAAIIYAVRSGVAGLPEDDRVVYGKIGVFGHLLHEIELKQGAALASDAVAREGEAR